MKVQNEGVTFICQTAANMLLYTVTSSTEKFILADYVGNVTRT